MADCYVVGIRWFSMCAYAGIMIVTPFALATLIAWIVLHPLDQLTRARVIQRDSPSSNSHNFYIDLHVPVLIVAAFRFCCDVGRPIVFHCFSTGGYIMGNVLNNIHSDKSSLADKYAGLHSHVKGQVYDSVVDWQVYVYLYVCVCVCVCLYGYMCLFAFRFTFNKRT